MPTPLALKSAIFWKRASTSLLVRAEVGSSMMRMRESEEIALRISSIWRSETERSFSSVVGP